MSRDWYVWLAIIGLMAMTLLTRSGLIVFGHRIELPRRLQRALRFAPMAAIAAIIVPGVLSQPVVTIADLFQPRTIAAVAALFGWWATRQMIVCMASGIAVYVFAKLVAV